MFVTVYQKFIPKSISDIVDDGLKADADLCSPTCAGLSVVEKYD